MSSSIQQTNCHIVHVIYFGFFSKLPLCSIRLVHLTIISCKCHVVLVHLFSMFYALISTVTFYQHSLYFNITGVWWGTSQLVTTKKLCDGSTVRFDSVRSTHHTKKRVWRVDRTEFLSLWGVDRTLFTDQSWEDKLSSTQCGSTGNSKWLCVWVNK